MALLVESNGHGWVRMVVGLLVVYQSLSTFLKYCLLHLVGDSNLIIRVKYDSLYSS